jgi:hypothetical protein
MKKLIFLFVSAIALNGCVGYIPYDNGGWGHGNRGYGDRGDRGHHGDGDRGHDNDGRRGDRGDHGRD